MYGFHSQAFDLLGDRGRFLETVQLAGELVSDTTLKRGLPFICTENILTQLRDDPGLTDMRLYGKVASMLEELQGA